MDSLFRGCFFCCLFCCVEVCSSFLDSFLFFFLFSLFSLSFEKKKLSIEFLPFKNSEYDQTLFEDQRQNRMRESLQLFHDACGSAVCFLFYRFLSLSFSNLLIHISTHTNIYPHPQWFKESTMILFLNKVDLFQKKIQTIDLNVCFKSYTGFFSLSLFFLCLFVYIFPQMVVTMRRL